MSFENRVSRWMRKSDPPTVRESVTKWGDIFDNGPAKSLMKSSAGSLITASYFAWLALNQVRSLLASRSLRNEKSWGVK